MYMYVYNVNPCVYNIMHMYIYICDIHNWQNSFQVRPEVMFLGL